MKTPELEKINANRDDSQKLGSFIAWLADDQNIVLTTYDGECKYDGTHEVYCLVNLSIEKLLALYFDVDLDKAEKERQGLLAELREQNEPG